ncbi:MAG: GNAT family N-acetyltransferase [Planctomycetota bacterium]
MTNPLSTFNSKLRLRFATEADTKSILDFIKALAEYERLAHEVVTDEESLRESLFKGRKVAEVVIADYYNEPAGFALFFHNYSTFLGKPGLYLEDLFVKPEFRGNGIGRELLSCMARIAVDRGCGRLEWWVLDWNESAIRFYKNLGGQPMDEWTVFRVTDDALTRLAEANE